MLKNRLINTFILALFVFILSVGFKDAGIFVTDYTVKIDDKVVEKFKDGEEIVLAKENKDSFQVIKGDFTYLIPKNAMIRTTRGTNEYKTIAETKVYADASYDSKVITTLKEGTIVSLEKTNKEFGYFTYAKDKAGFIDFSSLQRIEKQNITYGYAKEDKVISSNGKYLALIKNEKVSIIDYKDGKYIITDNKGNEFTVGKTLIGLYETLEDISRGATRTASDDITDIINAAHSLIGKPYVYGATGPNSFDCSGFTYSLYRNVLNITIPRSSINQANAGIKVNKFELRPGDLVFFNTVGRNISHVGLYIGDGKMIHASSGRKMVTIDNIFSGWYSGRYVTARRIIK